MASVETIEGMGSPLLEARGLVHRFRDGSLGLDGADFILREGDFMVMAGRNGSGKTLLMRHLIGLREADEGHVFYRGLSLEKNLRLVRSRVGLVFQEAESQIVGQTVAEDVAFGPANLRLARAEVKRRTEAALEAVDMSWAAMRRPDSLSGGERRRLAIAGVLAMEAECLILDEPFANLDLPSIRLVLKSLVDLHAAGKAILVLTHELEKVLAQATRLLIMEGGRVVWDGAPEGPGPQALGAWGLMDPYRGGLKREALSWLA